MQVFFISISHTTTTTTNKQTKHTYIRFPLYIIPRHAKRARKADNAVLKLQEEVTKCYERLGFKQGNGLAEQNVKAGSTGNDGVGNVSRKPLLVVVQQLNTTEEGREQLIKSIGWEALLDAWILHNASYAASKSVAQGILTSPIGKRALRNVKAESAGNDGVENMSGKSLQVVVQQLNTTKEGRKQLGKAIGLEALLDAWILYSAYYRASNSVAQSILTSPLGKKALRIVEDRDLANKRQQLLWRVICMFSKRFNIPMRLKLPYLACSNFTVKKMNEYTVFFTSGISVNFTKFTKSWYGGEVFLSTTKFWRARMFYSVLQQRRDIPVVLFIHVWEMVTSDPWIL